jgi:hypothetical protein
VEGVSLRQCPCGIAAASCEYHREPSRRMSDAEGKEYLELARRFPHCDAFVLHVRGKCEFCDLPENDALHAFREERAINHTGERDPAKATCPAEARRPKDVIDRWGGNRATTAEDLREQDEQLAELLKLIGEEGSADA